MSLFGYTQVNYTYQRKLRIEISITEVGDIIKG